MDDVMHYLTMILDFVRAGYDHVNALLGILIALIAAFRLTKWQELWKTALAAMLIHLVIEIVTSAAIRLPPLFTLGFWRDTAALYVGYVVVISVFYFLRTVFSKNH